MSANWQAEIVRDAMTTLRPWLQVKLLGYSQVLPIEKLQTMVDAAEYWIAESEPTVRLVFPKRRRGRKARAVVSGKKK